MALAAPKLLEPPVLWGREVTLLEMQRVEERRRQEEREAPYQYQCSRVKQERDRDDQWLREAGALLQQAGGEGRQPLPWQAEGPPTSSKKRRERVKRAAARNAMDDQKKAMEEKLQRLERMVQESDARNRALESHVRSQLVQGPPPAQQPMGQQQDGPAMVGHPDDYLLDLEDISDASGDEEAQEDEVQIHLAEDEAQEWDGEVEILPPVKSSTRQEAEKLLAAKEGSWSCGGVPVSRDVVEKFLASTGKKACLCDAGLMAGLNLIKMEAKGRRRARRAQVQILEVIRFNQLLKEMQIDPKHRTERQPQVVLAQYIGNEYTLGVVHVVRPRFKHWYLVGVHKTAEGWATIGYDSLRGEDDEGARDLLVKALIVQKCTPPYPEMGVSCPPMLRGLTQKNDTDCGILVLETARRLLAGEDLAAEADTTVLREKWALALLQNDIKCVQW